MHTYVAPTPTVFINTRYLQQGIIGEALNIVCMIAPSSTAQLSLFRFTWNFTSNDDRVSVIPTNITTDDSIGIIYSSIIQFAYLMEGDEGNYKCTLTIVGDSAQSIFSLEIIGK